MENSASSISAPPRSVATPIVGRNHVRMPEFTVLAFAAIAAGGLSTHIASAETPSIECADLSKASNDEAPFAAGLNVLASKQIDPSQIEAACRTALKADPANPTILFRLGRALSVAKSYREAMKYYLDAAERGNAGAMNDLGGVFEYGLAVPKNLATALLWYERAAELRHRGAMTHLGELNENGVDVPQDFVNARRWYERAAALDSAASMNHLADLFRYGRGMAPDAAAAATWYLKASRLGHTDAMNSLGELSELGAGVPQNDETARSWYKRAADLGHADAMGNLGALFENGKGGPQSLEMARAWYVKGAALNSRIAMHRLGAMLENGRGAPKDLTEAKLWYERAAALEYPSALNDLGRLYLAGVGGPKNYVRAKTSFERAAQLGDAKAMNNLGLLYLNGTGVQRDINIARSWFEQAISRNNADARENLKGLDDAGLVDGTQVAERRASCMRTCATLHQSYVNSVCERYSEAADSDMSERAKCVRMSLTVAQQCRGSCREWAPAPLADNRCMMCFETLVACSISPSPPGGQGDDLSYAVNSKGCLSALANCTASCSEQTAPAAGTSKASRGKLK
jgi:TPR repeat protein